MAIQMTIIGLGEIGTSLGLALAYQKNEITRVGNDAHKYAEENALKIGAVDKITHNLYDAVREADIVVLAIPLPEAEETLKLIGRELKEGAVILDFAPGKVNALQSAKQHLAAPDHYLGVYAAVNPDRLSELSREHHTAHEDLFKNGTLFIVPSAETDPAVVKLGSDLAMLIGAHCGYIEPEELDGFLAFTVNLPKLVASGILASVFSQVSWMEMRKIAGKEFAHMTGLIAEPQDQAQFVAEMNRNRENTLRVLNGFILALKEYRDAIQDQDEMKLKSLYEGTEKGREQWLREYESGAWRQEKENRLKPPSMGETLGQMFLGGLAKPRKRDA